MTRRETKKAAGSPGQTGTGGQAVQPPPSTAATSKSVRIGGTSDKKKRPLATR